MTRDDALSVLRDALARIAPEVDLDEVDADAELREELELDSMDFLNLMVAIKERTGIEVPERDYPLMASLNSSIEYLTAHVAA
ncbi:MAG TPA: acyl carrier protein [Acidimicrobiales bacterium]|nr:acyl carrier protein [Acidimicrobiales bacterium]